MKKHIKKITYFGTTVLLIVMPFLFINVSKSSNEIIHQKTSHTTNDSIESNQDEIEISWTNGIFVDDFSFSFNEETLDYEIKGSNPISSDIYQSIYFGIQDIDDTSEKWTPEEPVLQNIVSESEEFEFQGNFAEYFEQEIDLGNIQEELWTKPNLDFFIGYKDKRSEYPGGGDWQNELFEKQDKTRAKASGKPLIASITDLAAIDETSTTNSVELGFEFREGIYYDNLLYKINNDDDWIETPSLEDGENELLIENINPIEENTIKFKFKGAFGEEDYFKEEEFKFQADPINSIINNLEAKNITTDSADIDFELSYVNTNSNFSYKLKEEGTPEDWIDFVPTQGNNRLKFNNLKEGVNYIFQLKNEESKRDDYSVEFKTLEHSVIDEMSVHNIDDVSAKVSFNVDLGDEELNDKFYYRTTNIEESSSDDWIEFRPLEGDNTITLLFLSEDVDYIFEIRTNQNTYNSIEFKTAKKESTVDNLSIKNVKPDYAEIVVDIDFGNPSLNERFYYRIIPDEITSHNDNWIQFMPVDGENIIEVNGLEKDTNYIFEIQIDESIESTLEIRTSKDNSFWFFVSISVFGIILVAAVLAFVKRS